LRNIYIKKGGLDDKVNEAFVDLIKFIIEITAFDVVSSHESKFVATDIVQHANLESGCGYRFDVIFVY
jgi:hypothetical protein